MRGYEETMTAEFLAMLQGKKLGQVMYFENKWELVQKEMKGMNECALFLNLESFHV